MSPTLVTFAAEFRQLAADFLLPSRRLPSSRRPLRSFAALLLLAATLALGLAALVIGASAQLLEAVLGPARLDLAFPYLRGPLGLYGSDHHRWVALGVTVAGGVGAWLAARWLGRELSRRWLALAGLLLVLVVATAVDVAFTEGNGAVMEALNVRSAARFWGTAAGLSAIYLVTLPVQFLNSYGQQRFALAWRDRTTAVLSEAYLQNQNYYHLEAAAAGAGEIDNPDQRLADDIQRSVVSSTDLFFGFCTSLLSLAAYVLVLFQISGWLVLTLLVATAMGNGLIVPLVRRLARLGFRQQSLEADFRFALMHLRSHAESIAFLRGEAREARGLRGRFARVLVNLERLIRWRALVEQGSGLYAFLMQFVPYLVLSGAYFGGRVSLGQLTVGSIAFGQVQTALSFLVVRADDFSSLFASLDRVGELRGGLGAQVLLAAGGESAAAAASPAPVGLELHQLSVADPGGGPPLIEHLDLRVTPGERLLITGPSGCGKTSLLRVLCGLAPASAGRLRSPDPAQWSVLPQTPYMALGSLREQLLYGLPLEAPPPPDGALRSALAAAGVGALNERYGDLGVEEDWARLLSGGEQQRLGFARLLLAGRPFVLLDEATSALDLEAERQLYGLLERQGVTMISVGHRPSLRAFHQRLLRLDGRGGWTLEAA
ncbi:ABC transporter ATP-binding protein/permease [Cyanobium sp. Morenito 9A2]|uniref:ABC transporter ATP-binding protein/permease n=1 Tax=Cyanobium sp. Morenito 9A2 TaxID=2823718 RepID=UPI0020CD5B1F|nr:ATP-binding cassette domain-containing protein [Cyanobium sp. Morenito 9A2]MCP9848538.1 ABC transporter ATP-binding protein/permease [Cyanobium sp. Morenito 9A2]